MTVLPDSAQVPPRNTISPPPNQFTHRLSAKQPFYYSRPGQGAQPDGEFEAGTQVVLLVHEGGEFCHVADGRGLYVVTVFRGLKKDQGQG